MSLEAEVKFLHSYGFGNRIIADAIEMPHWKVGKLLPKLGLSTNNPRGNRIQAENGLFTCKVCNNSLPLKDFALLGKVDGRRLSTCKLCRKVRATQSLNESEIAYWREKQNKLIQSAKKRKLEFSLPEDYLYHLAVLQGNKCFYTNKTMNCQFGSGRSALSPSADRVNSTLGYVEGNVVLACSRVNSIKQDVSLAEMEEWLPSWYLKVIDNLDTLNKALKTIEPLNHIRNSAGKIKPAWQVDRGLQLERAKKLLQEFRND